MDRGDYPYIVWDGSDVTVTFDPITEEHLRRYSAIDAYGQAPDTYEIAIKDGVLIGPNKLPEPKESGSVTDEQNANKPSGDGMIKYPSGFWDITLTDLGTKHVTDL